MLTALSSALPSLGHPRRARWAAALAGTLAVLLTACAQVPILPYPPAPQSGTVIQVRGARGTLSQRETAVVLQRLRAQAPDATALTRHLTIEQAVAGSPLYTGNQVQILRDGPASFGAMFAAIHSAQHFLYLEYYIFEDVEFNQEHLGDLLVEQSQHGVHIVILYDGIGSLSTPGAFFDRLRAAGIAIQVFHPITPLASPWSLNARDHRKLLIADGERAIIGGVNLSTDYQSAPSASAPKDQSPAQQTWHDTDLLISGPAVHDLQGLFEQHWREVGSSSDALEHAPVTITPAGDQVVRIIGSQGGALKPHYYGTLLAAIRSATTRVWITASYFVPTFQEHEALARAARRGVDVRLLLPAHSDSGPALDVQHSHYGALLRAGVKIYEREDGILHTKSLVADGVWSIVGSSNFDHRSVLFNDEVDAVVIGSDTASKLEDYFQGQLQNATPITLDTWRHRGWSRKVREQFWRLWEQWL